MQWNAYVDWHVTWITCLPTLFYSKRSFLVAPFNEGLYCIIQYFYIVLVVPTTPGTVPLRFLCHALSSSSSTHSLAIPLSLTEGLSEATHISKDARASKWDAALLSRKQSHLLSLTLCCPAGSALQSTEDGTEITIMQCQRSQFLSHSHIGTPSAESLTQTHR